MLSGSFLIEKPDGMTSSDVVVQLKIALTHQGYAVKGFKIGHGGTLDPFATGVLVVLVGEGTKLADVYLHSKKAYRGIIQLGIKMDSADLTGTEVERKSVPSLTASEWQTHADFFIQNPYWQIPPMHSAKKHEGRALHELARAGIEIERKPILKQITSFQVRPVEGAPPKLAFRVECESGTYVRVIAEDLALRAGTVAHLTKLERIQSSDVQLEQCASLEKAISDLKEKKELSTLSYFRPLSKLATHVSCTSIPDEDSAWIRQGQLRVIQPLCLQVLKNFPSQRYVIARDGQGLVALFEKSGESDQFRMQRVFNS